MNSRNTIIILANKYPNINEPNVNVFTQQIGWSLVDQGCEVIVICPIAINYSKRNWDFPSKRTEVTESGRNIEIYHPRYIGFGQNNNIALKLRVRLTTFFYSVAVEKILKELLIKRPIVLGEFICPSGVSAAILGKKYNLNSYMQFGEAYYRGNEKYGNKYLKKIFRGLTGVIALSGQNHDYLVNAGVISSDKIIILPSGYRKSRMHKKNQKEARKKLGLPKDKFIVGYCGSYDERKGILRLENAVDLIDDENVVYAACGSGQLVPTSKKCVLTGQIDHKELAWFYSSLDVFVFPTYNEGCCTAIVEAIACGCPIISSDRSFNYEICNKTNSILINPSNIEEIKHSIVILKGNDELRRRLSEGSLKMSQSLSLDDKAKKMIEYFKWN